MPFDEHLHFDEEHLDDELDVQYVHWRAMRNHVADTVRDEPLSDPKEPTRSVEGALFIAAMEAEGEVFNIGTITPPIEGEQSA